MTDLNNEEPKPETATDPNWLDEIVTRHLDANIDRLAKGREYLINARSRELLKAMAGNVVIDVLAELMELDDLNERLT